MRRADFVFVGVMVLVSTLTVGCHSKEQVDVRAAAPPETKVIEQPDLNVIKVDRPERFKLVAATDREELPKCTRPAT